MSGSTSPPILPNYGGTPTPVLPNTTLAGGNLFSSSAAASAANPASNGNLLPNWSTNSQNPDLNGNMPTITVTPNGGSQTSPTNGPTVSTPTAPQANPQQLTTPQFLSGEPQTNPPISTTPVPNGNNTISQQLVKTVQPNPLNNFYQPAYHFRLFVLKDIDVLTQTGTIAGIAGLPQVTIVETGVTGYNIRDVEIQTFGAATNESTLNMSGTSMTINVVEPLGVSFLDAMVGAVNLINGNNPNKVTYYLELTFTGYSTTGVFAGRPLNVLSGLANGGKWIWSLNINMIATKLDEGAASYSLQCTILAAQMLTRNDNFNPQKLPQAITVSGNTVGDIYQDFVKKANDAWVYQYGGQKKTALVTYLPIRTHKITTGPPTAIGKDPGSFRVMPTEADKSSSRVWSMQGGNKDNLVTCQLAAGTSVSDFLISVINATKEGQELAKDLAQQNAIDASATTVNSKGFRECMTFTVNPYISITGYDIDHNNYIRNVQMDVIPHYTQEPIISKNQLTQAQSTAVQQAMVQNLITNGFVKKRYDYIFTGLNTEVIDMDLSWNMSWQAILPKLVGAQKSYTTEAVQGLFNTGSYPVSPDGTTNQAASDLQTQPANTPTQLNPSSSYTAATGTSTGTPFATGPRNSLLTPNWQSSVQAPNQTSTQPSTLAFTNWDSLVTPGPNANPVAAGVAQTLMANQTSAVMANLAASQQAVTSSPIPASAPVVATSPTSTAPPSNQIVTSPATNLSGGNVYVEDFTSAGNNNHFKTLPISLWSGFLNVQNRASNGIQQSYHRDQSVLDSMFAQLDADEYMNGKFQTIELTIRGDPFWLGQTDIDRQIQLNKGTYYDSSSQALPDYGSGNQHIFIHFKYPLQIGDNFTPILNNCATFSGFYGVTNVVHKFSEGNFTQVLHCVRHNLISASVLNASATNNTGTTAGAGANPGLGQGNTVPSGGTTPTPGTSIPGVPRGITNNNPTNLSYYPSQPNLVGTDGTFGQYPTMQDGIAAAQNQLLINQNQHGYTTLSQQLTAWAPPNENNTSAYITAVSQQTGIGPNDPIDMSDPTVAQPVVTAIIQQEVGGSAASQISPQTISSGVAQGTAYYNSSH
jgi:hypothetical protein